MDHSAQTDIESTVFRRLVQHLRERTDVQNIDLMRLAGFCRNCLSDWFRQAAAEKGIVLAKEEARKIVYGMPAEEWKKRFQMGTSAEQEADFARAEPSEDHT